MNINHYTKIFIKNIMLGLGNVHLSLFDKDHIFKVLQKAYMAMSPRTLGKGKAKGAKISIKNRNIVLSTLADKFIDYFSSSAKSEKEFNEWHSQTCNEFMDSFNALLKKSQYTRIMNYGKAQKIVNVAFKYFYMFCDSGEISVQYFEFCHFTIDKYTLRWYNKYNIGASYTKSWSNMSEKEYFRIQSEIFAHIRKTTSDITPFLAEFEIWSDLYYGE